MNILLTGVDGYLGWPTFLKLSKAFPKDRIVGVDHCGRRRWVEEIGSVSAIPILTMEERLNEAGKQGFDNISFIERDLSKYSQTRDLIAIYKPEVVIHTAAQPSAPYAQINARKAEFTQDNNIAMTRNILWALREEGLISTHFIETTTTGIYGTPSFEIPEGDIKAIGVDGNTAMIPYPNMASSWYHVSKGFNVTNMRLMHFQTKMPISDVRTSIIYGLDTEETKDNRKLSTRFDFDFYFGTILNRWCAMAVSGELLTVYGSGNQIKPFIHIEDAAKSLVNLVKKGSPAKFRVYNQLTEYIRIKHLAQTIAEHINVEVSNISNPRKEKEDEEYRFENSRFMDLLSGKPRQIRESIGEVLNALIPYRNRIRRYRDRVLT